MPEGFHSQTRSPQNSVTKEVTEPLEKLGEVIKGLAAKNATMKDGKPEASDKKEGRPPTTTEERISNYEKYKSDISEINRNFPVDSNGKTIDPIGKSLAVGQAIIDLGVAVGPEVFKLGIDAVGVLKGK